MLGSHNRIIRKKAGNAVPYLIGSLVRRLEVWTYKTESLGNRLECAALHNRTIREEGCKSSGLKGLFYSESHPTCQMYSCVCMCWTWDAVVHWIPAQPGSVRSHAG